MKKLFRRAGLVLGVCLATTLMLSQMVFAGPFIEFGDSGWMQIDLKLQGIGDFTNFGSGTDGDKSRSDLYLRRARFVFTGMLDDTWGAKFQT